MKILIKDFVNRVGISEDVIKRLKGLKTLSHILKSESSIENIKNGKLEKPLLSKDTKYLYLEDLKILIVYSLVRTNDSILENVSTVQDILSKKSIDDSITSLILLERKKYRLIEDEILKGLNLNNCLKILEELYPKNPQNFYTLEDMLAINEVVYKENLTKNNVVIQEENEIATKSGNNILEDIFEKYSKEKNGYFPLQHPTGNGKTFHLENFLVKNIINDFKDLEQDKIIVITNNKININEIYRGIIRKLKEHSQENKKNYIFQMKSVSDILNNIQFLDEVLNDLDKKSKFYNFFPNKESFIKRFKEKIRLLKEYVNKKIQIDSNEFLKEQMSELKKYMFKFFNLKEKNDNYENIELPKFLYKLFPMILEENLEKKIFIMTTDKFLYGYIGRGGTQYFYENSKKNLIFIDEIDSTKDKILNFIKNRRTLNIQNIIDVFNDRYNSFSKFDNNQLNILLKKLSKKQSLINPYLDEESIKNRKEALGKKVKVFMRNGWILRRKYFTTKRYFELENESRVDLFESENHYVQSDGKKLYVDITEDSCLITERKTSIELTKLIDDLFNYSYNQFYKLLNEIYDFHILLKEDNEVEKEIVSNIIYNLESQKEILNEYKNYYIQKVKILQDNKKSMDKEYSYIQIYEVNPDYKTNRKVKIGCQYMYITPEEFLYSICKDNFVFGISATANIDTCVGNFDIKWLKSRLKDRYFQMTSTEKKSLKKSLLRINSFEKNIERELGVFRDTGVLLTEQSKGFNSAKSFFNDSKKYKLQKNIIGICNTALGSVDNIIDDDLRMYQKDCISYAITVFLNFLLNEETSSLLFLSNRFTHKDALKKAALEMGKQLKKKIYFKDYKSKELDEALKIDKDENELMENLKDYKTKTIIFTTYQSAGVGVNIKHTYSKRLDKNLIKVNNEIQEETGISLNYKDIDEIALENKTNIVSFEDLFNEKIILLYYTNLLLRNKTLKKYERSLLLNRFDDMYFKKIYKQRYDYIENVVGKIIQGIGRCNRTKVRCKKRNIYLDNDCFEVIKKFKGADRLFIEDFNFLLEEVSKEEGDGKNNFQLEILKRDNDIRRYFEYTYLDEISTYNHIIRNSNDENIRSKYIDDFIKIYNQYKRFRLYILKNPTRNLDESDSVAYFSTGEKLDSYTVIGSAGDKIDNIVFNSINGNVSKKDCRLDELKAIPLLKNILETKVGRFEKNEEIILPYIYQAIFKGTLGEILIKEIFRIYDIRVKNIIDTLSMGMLEIFDDISEGGMYIDYKNYNLEKLSSREFFNDIIRDKIIQKREYISSGKKLFIVNLISNKSKILNTDITFYKLEDIYNENYKTCDYEESKVIIVSGILRYRENSNRLEINESLVRELKIMLEDK